MFTAEKFDEENVSNLTATEPSLNRHPYAYIETTMYYIEGVGIICIGIIGIIINIFATRLLLRIKHRYIFHNLLLTLTIYDLLQIILSIPTFALPHLSPTYRNQIFIHVVPFLIPVAQITVSGSSYTTVTLTIERYISLCAPYLRYTYGIKAGHYILPVLILCINCIFGINLIHNCFMFLFCKSATVRRAVY